MKIVDIKTRVLTYRFEKPLRLGHGTYPHRQYVIVEVHTDEGIVGYGEIDSTPASDGSVVSIVEHSLKPKLVGEDPLYIERLYRLMLHMPEAMGRKGLEIYCISAIDTALWDIMGQAADLSVFKLLGGYVEEFPAYASLPYVSPTELPPVLENILGEGYRSIKLRVGVEPDQDIEVVRTARDVVGPKVGLMVDVNSAWRRHEALKKARALEEYDLCWLEEPLRPWEIEGHAELAKCLDTPIALGEHHFTSTDFAQLLSAKAMDIAQPDIRQGGLTECRKVASLVGAFGLSCVPHFFGSAVRWAATLHLLGGIPNGLWAECPVSNDPMRSEILAEPIVVKNGRVRIPSGPGLGVSLNEEVLAFYEQSI